jgi:hypothetical protein
MLEGSCAIPNGSAAAAKSRHQNSEVSNERESRTSFDQNKEGNKKGVTTVTPFLIW